MVVFCFPVVLDLCSKLKLIFASSGCSFPLFLMFRPIYIKSLSFFYVHNHSGKKWCKYIIISLIPFTVLCKDSTSFRQKVLQASCTFHVAQDYGTTHKGEKDNNKIHQIQGAIKRNTNCQIVWLFVIKHRKCYLLLLTYVMILYIYTYTYINLGFSLEGKTHHLSKSKNQCCGSWFSYPESLPFPQSLFVPSHYLFRFMKLLHYQS